MPDEPTPAVPPPDPPSGPRRGYKDSLDPAAHLQGRTLRVFRILSLAVAVVVAIAACAFAVCALNFRE